MIPKYKVLTYESPFEWAIKYKLRWWMPYRYYTRTLIRGLPEVYIKEVVTFSTRQEALDFINRKTNQ